MWDQSWEPLGDAGGRVDRVSHPGTQAASTSAKWGRLFCIWVHVPKTLSEISQEACTRMFAAVLFTVE